MLIIKFSLFNHCDLQYFDHSWIFFFRYTFWFAMVVCHFLFTSTQFARLFSSKLSKILSLNVGKRSRMVSIVKFCEFWTLLFFACDFKCLFGFRLKPMFSPLDRMIWAFTEFNFFIHIQKLPRKKNRIFTSSYDNFYIHNWVFYKYYIYLKYSWRK